MGRGPNTSKPFRLSISNIEVSEVKRRAILEKRGVGKVWEILEGDVDYEIEAAFLKPEYTSVEGIWFDDDLDWIIYASHEIGL